MTRERLPSLVRPAFGVLAGALFVDLLLDWNAATVVTPLLDARAGTSGLTGWGAVAAVLLVALMAWEVRLLLRDTDPERPEVVLSVGLGLAAAALAAVRFFTGGASVDVGVIDVGTEAVRWPAYAGLALALLLAGASVARWAVEPRAHPTLPRTTAQGSV